MKPYELVPRDGDKVDEKEIEDKSKDVEEEENEGVEENEVVKRVDMARDAVGGKYMKRGQSLCFLKNTVFVVEVPVSKNNKPEIKDAKMKEIQNLEDYETLSWWKMLDRSL